MRAQAESAMASGECIIQENAKASLQKGEPKAKQGQKRAAEALKVTHANEAILKAARNKPTGIDSE